jgi:Domain of Unknown Function with PDB structure (DUF3857)
MNPFPRALALFALVVCLGIFCSQPSLAVEDWRAIDPAELALKASVVEKDSDAEALFWEVRVDDGAAGEIVFSNYVRVKVFTERGKESQSQIDLQYLGSNKIKDISARTIKPDGSIAELKKDDVHERTIVKASGLKVKAKSFAMPGVEPGAIIEYRWKEVQTDSDANYTDLQFQRDIPARSVTYLVRPYTGPYAQALAYKEFHMPPGVKFEKAKDGFYRVSLANVPAYREEPRMPPEDEVRAWILLFYNQSGIAPGKFWVDMGKRLYESNKEELKVNDEVRKKATEIVGDATQAEDKLKRIYEFCQTKIRNLSRASITSEERAKLAKDIKSPADTLKKGMGRGGNIDNLFAALVNAAGLEAYRAYSGNRQEYFLDEAFPNLYFLMRGSSFVAVRLGETWQFFSPAETYTPFGMLGWREDGQKVLVASKDPVWADVPISAPDKSLEKSTGKFRLLEDGTLEGDVRIEYTGQFAIDKKMANEDDSVVQREETLRDKLKARLSTAEVSEIKIENVTEPIKPFTYSFHVRIPGYAQRTGKRLFIQPSFFRHGIGPMFAAAERRQSIYFHYAWSEKDDVEIEFPPGFALDNADKPGPFKAGVTSEYKINLGVSPDGRKLLLQREFFFGGGTGTMFPRSSYGQLKMLFDQLNKADEHTITLKQAASN